MGRLCSGFRLMGVAIFAGGATSADTSLAQDAVAQFYRDKTVTVIIGSTPGGGVDIYGRLIARHIGKHIPGNPKVVASNLPGAGSLVAAAHIYSAAASDGTQFGNALAGAILDPLLSAGTRKYEPARFSFIGNANLETQVCIVRADAAVKTFADVFKTEFVVGGSGPGSALTLYPLFLKNFFGAKVRLVAGYPGSREISLAVQKGEVQGTCGLNFSSAKTQYPDLGASGAFRILVQEDVNPSNAPALVGVPLAADYLKPGEDRRVLDVFYAQSKINRVFFAPPDIPADRLAALRKAFMATIADSETQAEARKMQIDLEATSGEEVQALVAKLFTTPAEIVERMKKATAN